MRKDAWMIFNFTDRPAQSTFIEAVWHNQCESGGPFLSMAVNHWAMVVTRLNGTITLTMRGPELKATPAYCPPGAEHFGCYFKMGVYLTHLPTHRLRDTAITLPSASSRSFWLNGSTWQYPDYENIDTFVDRLARAGTLVYDPKIVAALQGQPVDTSLRTLQRRFLHTTGLTHSAVRQIERARFATSRLQDGASILDVVYDAGYADQPHLTRALKAYIGQTPAQLGSGKAAQLSFLFKTSPST
jgi:AraC-like DNA-binding protein